MLTSALVKNFLTTSFKISGSKRDALQLLLDMNPDHLYNFLVRDETPAKEASLGDILANARQPKYTCIVNNHTERCKIAAIEETRSYAIRHNIDELLGFRGSEDFVEGTKYVYLRRKQALDLRRLLGPLGFNLTVRKKGTRD